MNHPIVIIDHPSVIIVLPIVIIDHPIMIIVLPVVITVLPIVIIVLPIVIACRPWMSVAHQKNVNRNLICDAQAASNLLSHRRLHLHFPFAR